MQTQVHLTFTSEEEFATFAKKFVTESPLVMYSPKSKAEVKETIPEKETTPKTAKPTMNEKLAIKAAKETAVEMEETPEEVSNDEPVEPTFDNVKTKILAVAKKTKSKEAAVAILQKYKAATVVALNEKDYAAVIEDCDELLAA